MKIIICESGATKADWRLIEDGIQTYQVYTPGTNVSTMKMKVIASIIEERDRFQFLPVGWFTDCQARQIRWVYHRR